jgi:phenylalanyl-tRNA synthetase beta chain
MQISLKWINELVTIDMVILKDLLEKLTLGGFEVEEILEFEINNEKQYALDISSTANRSDSLSIQGISAEIKTLLNKESKISSYSRQLFDWQEKIKKSSKIIADEDNSYCSTFIAVTIENLNNTTVPNWIKNKLISSGLTPLNNLLDFQNYILLETGYPFAFYDLEKICFKLNKSEFKLSLSKSKNNEEFTTSNNLFYQLDNSTLVVKADEVPLSIAGIIENKDFAYSETTKSLLIEGSIFNAAKIRQQSRNLGLRTDRSARYEKSLKNTYLVEALYRLLALLRILNSNLICKFHTSIKTIDQSFKPIFLRYKTVNEILGPINEYTQNHFNFIKPEIITSYLTRLNFQFLYNPEEVTWEVKIPHSRSDDIKREIDLIEEIGRLHGFNNFLTTLPKLKTIGNEDYSYQTRQKINSCLLNLGFNELIHYSLVNETTFLDNKIKLLNPLLADYASLRSSLLPNLIKTVHENVKQGNLFIEGFEYGHVFSGNILKNLKEKEYVAGIFGGIKTKLTWSDKVKSITWFEAKGKIEKLFKQLNIVIYWKLDSSLNTNIFHPYRSAVLYLSNGIKLGTFGQIHPLLFNQLSLPSEIYLFEFDVEIIKNQIHNKKWILYKEYSLYPKIIKDLSFIINQDITFEEIQKVIYSNGTKFLSTINLLDEYRGNPIPDKHISLCLQLVFQSKEKTLKNKEIENIINNLQLVLAQKFGARIRE